LNEAAPPQPEAFAQLGDRAGMVALAAHGGQNFG
jgi:hypothetical protein